jgi:Domain of unknown function (DUF5753)
VVPEEAADPRGIRGRWQDAHARLTRRAWPRRCVRALTRLWDHLKKGHRQRRYGWCQQWADIEAQAAVLRWYEPLVVPGLLQTGEYARAILSARPDGNLDDLDEQVAARLARLAILGRTGAPQLWCILDEGVLHRAICGSKVMRSQLYRLAEVAGTRRPPSRSSAPAAPTQACWRTSVRRLSAWLRGLGFFGDHADNAQLAHQPLHL